MDKRTRKFRIKGYEYCFNIMQGNLWWEISIYQSEKHKPLRWLNIVLSPYDFDWTHVPDDLKFLRHVNGMPVRRDLTGDSIIPYHLNDDPYDAFHQQSNKFFDQRVWCCTQEEFDKICGRLKHKSASCVAVRPTLLKTLRDMGILDRYKECYSKIIELWETQGVLSSEGLFW